jgi:hypothetical protein
LIERIEAGLCHKQQPLHFIGTNFNQPIPGGVKELELENLPNFNQLIPIGVETLKLWNLPNLKTNNVPKRFRHLKWN